MTSVTSPLDKPEPAGIKTEETAETAGKMSHREVTAARLRHGRASVRCEACGSYRMVAGVCQHCEWIDSEYEPPQPREVSKEEQARRMAEPCTPSSDITTFMTPSSLQD
jgi:hypothetical protein